MDFSQTRIAVLEDSMTDLLILRKMLLELGFRKDNISEFGKLGDLHLSGEQLILSDLNLPDSSGRDTLKSVLQLAEANQVFVIVLSGLTDEKLAQEAIQMGAQDYLIKATYGTGILKKTLTFAFERIRSLQTRAAKRSDQPQDDGMKVALSLVPSWVFRCDANLEIDFQSKPRDASEGEHLFIGQKIQSLFPEDQRDLVTQHVKRTLQTGSNQSFSAQWNGKDRSRTQVVCALVPADDAKVYMVITEDEVR